MRLCGCSVDEIQVNSCEVFTSGGAGGAPAAGNVIMIRSIRRLRRRRGSTRCEWAAERWALYQQCAAAGRRRVSEHLQQS